MLPGVEWAEARHVPRTLPVAALYLVVLLFFVALALLFGLHLAGLVGALIAIPLVAGLSESLDQLYLHRNHPHTWSLVLSP